MKTDMLNKLVTLLLVIGGLNVGITQVTKTNYLEKLLGGGTTLPGVLYVIIGVAALLGLYHLLDETMHHSTH
ncbi:MAG: DUF378 domain-containing protein [Acidimicrobiia bacterium]|nr:DUF378 domain-containing protein [Acidimicrobiia bacterium]